MIKIDNEFSGLIYPLTTEEFNGLEKSILAEGCRDAICVWNDIIVDGHNRFKICEKHNIKYKTHDMDFASRNEAKIWIINNQFNRRNLNAYQRGDLALKLKEYFKEKGKENQGTRTDLNNICPNLDKCDTKHGKYGEELVIKKMENDGFSHTGPWEWYEDPRLGFNPIFPTEDELQHSFDHCFFKNHEYIFGDTKAKAKRNIGDTGLDFSCWDKYCRIHYNQSKCKNYIDFYIFFVDEHPEEERIYYIKISEVGPKQKMLHNEGYIRIQCLNNEGKSIIYFDSSLWIHFKNLTRLEVDKLKTLANRGYKYEKT